MYYYRKPQPRALTSTKVFWKICIVKQIPMDFGTLVEDQQVQDSTLVGKYYYQELMNIQIFWMMLLENQKHITLDQ